MQKLGPLQTAWVEELRSGKRKQGKENLHTVDVHGVASFCCLGVACDMEAKAGELKATETGRFVEYGRGFARTSLPDHVIGKYGFFDCIGRIIGGRSEPHSLASLNDDGLTFDEIANFIEEDPSRVFGFEA